MDLVARNWRVGVQLKMLSKMGITQKENIRKWYRKQKWERRVFSGAK